MHVPLAQPRLVQLENFFEQHVNLSNLFEVLTEVIKCASLPAAPQPAVLPVPMPAHRIGVSVAATGEQLVVSFDSAWAPGGTCDAA